MIERFECRCTGGDTGTFRFFCRFKVPEEITVYCELPIISNFGGTISSDSRCKVMIL